MIFPDLRCIRRQPCERSACYRCSWALCRRAPALATRRSTRRKRATPARAHTSRRAARVLPGTHRDTAGRPRALEAHRLGARGRAAFPRVGRHVELRRGPHGCRGDLRGWRRGGCARWRRSRRESRLGWHGCGRKRGRRGHHGQRRQFWKRRCAVTARYISPEPEPRVGSVAALPRRLLLPRGNNLGSSWNLGSRECSLFRPARALASTFTPVWPLWVSSSRCSPEQWAALVRRADASVARQRHLSPKSWHGARGASFLMRSNSRRGVPPLPNETSHDSSSSIVLAHLGHECPGTLRASTFRHQESEEPR